MHVVCLVPAYNEAARIQQTVQAISRIEQVNEIVVIDDGSTDATAELAANSGAKVIKQQPNQGKGQALNAGYQQVTADVYLLLDADLGDSATQAGKLLEPVLRGEADMTIAHFAEDQSQQPGGKMGFGLAKKLAQWGIKYFTGFCPQSPLSGQRAVRRLVLEEVGGFAPDFGVEAALTIDALRHGFSVIEIPLAMTHRSTGRGLAGFKHRARQGVMVCKVLWRAWRGK